MNEEKTHAPKVNRPRVYISGGISGYSDRNVAAFNLAKKRLTDAGFDAINPHDINLSDEDRYKCLRRDIIALMDCNCIFMLDGWENSEGAVAEKHIADLFRIPSVKLTDDGMTLIHPVWKKDVEDLARYHYINSTLQKK